MGVAYRSNSAERSYSFCNILSQGLDLSPVSVCAGHPNVILGLAIRRDDDRDDYLEQRLIPGQRYPSCQACLTYLVLQARADPNINRL